MTTQQFDALVRQYEKLVFTVCYQMVKDYQEAQNLTQETFLSAYLHRESCRPDSAKAWLVRIATNKAKDYLKSAYARRVEADGGQAAELLADPALLPEEDALSREGMEAISRHIYSLKEPYAQVSVLFFLQEKSVEEIAENLHRPKKTVQTQIYRAKHILQEKLKKEAVT